MRSVGEAAKTILKSRSDEIDAHEHEPVTSPQIPSSVKPEPKAIISSADESIKKSEVNISRTGESTSATALKHEEILPDVDKTLALEGTVRMKQRSTSGKDTSGINPGQ